MTDDHGTPPWQQPEPARPPQEPGFAAPTPLAPTPAAPLTPTASPAPAPFGTGPVPPVAAPTPAAPLTPTVPVGAVPRPDIPAPAPANPTLYGAAPPAYLADAARAQQARASAPGGPTPPTGEQPVVPRPPTTRRAWWVRGVVAAVMLALVAVSAYLVVVSRQWSDRVDELTAVSTDLGNQIATERTGKEQAVAAQADAETQLAELKARVTDLANEEANALDNEDTLRNYMDAMVSCADERAKILGNYGARWSGDDGTVISTRQYIAETATYCDEIKAEYAAYLAEVDG